MTESGLKLLLEKQQSLLKELLDFSQRQFAETDPVGLDNLLSQKDKCFEELQEVTSLREKWHQKSRNNGTRQQMSVTNENSEEIY